VVYGKLECGLMSNVMAALPNIGGALCESSVIHSLCDAAKFGWWHSLLECRAVTVTLPMSNAELGRKDNFASGEILSGSKSPRKCMYGVPAQETAKHRAKFGWSPVSDVAAVANARRETR